jgi:hypothetical protein
MRTHVIGIKPHDEKWKKMKAIWDNCEEMGITVPTEVSYYFNWESPDEQGVVLQLQQMPGVVEKFSNEYSSGFVVNVDKLPEDIKQIRFTNSW